jgi:transcriptional regulator with XRE-family HTH domain
MARALIATSSQADDRAATMSNVEEVVGGIGPRLASMRANLGLSLQQLSGLADVSAASIHKIERGDMVPTITTLLKLAGAFRRPISHLIGEESQDVDDVWQVPYGTGEVLDRGQAEVVLVSGPSVRFRTRTTTVTLPPGEALEEPALRGGESLVHVTAGSVRANLGSREYALRKGDTLHFPSDHAVSWTNTGRGSAELLHVSVPGN